MAFVVVLTMLGIIGLAWWDLTHPPGQPPVPIPPPEPPKQEVRELAGLPPDRLVPVAETQIEFQPTPSWTERKEWR